VLGIQQIAIGGPDKTRLQKLWVDMLGLEVTGTFKSERENVDEDICAIGSGPFKVEVDLMQPLDPEKKPAVHTTPLNHVGLWIDDLPWRWSGSRPRACALRRAASARARRVSTSPSCTPRPTTSSPIAGEGVLIELVQAPPEVVPLTLISVVLVQRLNASIAITEAERAGSSLIGELGSTIRTVQRHRGQTNLLLAGDSAARPLLERTRSELETVTQAVTQSLSRRSDFGLDSDWAALQGRVRALASLERSSANESFARHTELITDLRRMVYTVGERSYLLFDPEPETYFLMDLLVSHSLNWAELVAQIRAATCRPWWPRCAATRRWWPMPARAWPPATATWPTAPNSRRPTWSRPRPACTSSPAPCPERHRRRATRIGRPPGARCGRARCRIDGAGGGVGGGIQKSAAADERNHRGDRQPGVPDQHPGAQRRGGGGARGRAGPGLCRGGQRGAHLAQRSAASSPKRSAS
jgi:lactoylglutathione lyase